MSADSLKKVKILVLGNTGVGKTSLVHLICQDEVLSHPTWTIGCTVEVKLHSYTPPLRNPSSTSNYFLEFWDVGGAPYHKKGRPAFYQNVNGIILVHDLTNRKTHSHLNKWMAEFHNGPGKGAGSLSKTATSSRWGSLSQESLSNLDYDPEQFVDQEVPLLIVGTKKDQASSSGRGAGGVAGAATIHVNCRNPRQFSVDSSERIELNKFFDKVIEQRYFTGLKPPTTVTGPHMGVGGSRERHRQLSQRTTATALSSSDHHN